MNVVNLQNLKFFPVCAEKFNYKEYNNVFDLVYAIHVFSYISKKDTRKIINSVYETLKPGGVCCIQLLGKKDERNKWWRFGTSFYSSKKVQELFKSFSMIRIIEVEEVRHFSSPYGDAIFNNSNVFEVIATK